MIKTERNEVIHRKKWLNGYKYAVSVSQKYYVFYLQTYDIFKLQILPTVMYFHHN